MAPRALAHESISSLIVGLWKAEQVLGPQARGELIIDRSGPTWHARIAGFEAPVQHSNQIVAFSLPQGRGEFRGHIVANSMSIVGHWIQPASSFRNVRYASPVELRHSTSAVWKGTVSPLPEKCSFYILIQRRDDGLMRAVIHNPEFNYFEHQSYEVEVKGTAIAISNSRAKFEGTYDRETGRLELGLLSGYPGFRFRREPSIGRPARQTSKYVCQQPAVENDGWNTASLVDAGLDPKPLTALIDGIRGSSPADAGFNIHALLIARHGKLVLEQYFQGFDRDTAHDLRSASKTFAPMLLGIARQQGIKAGPDTPVYPLFPEYKPFANWDERKQRMTLHHLMTMTSGFECEDNDSSSPGSEAQMQSQTRQPDWYKYTLDLPMDRNPGGKHAIYCSADLNLVGGVVRNTTRRWLPEFFDQFFARELQIHSYYLNLMPNGDPYMGGGLYLRPRDALKLGQLYLSGGLWRGRRILEKDWVNISTTSHTAMDPVIETDTDHEYGYGWHIHNLQAAGRKYRIFAAEGNGGQFIIVIPALDMVVAIFGGSYNEIAQWYRWELELLPRFVIPAAIQKQPTSSTSENSHVN